MRILESTFTVGSNGALKIPASVLQKMGLFPGDNVRVAYLTSDGQRNSFQEFLLSTDPLDKLSDDRQLQVPNHLLEQSHIPVDADLQIVCIEGCIIICRDPALNPDELASVLEHLQAAEELTAALTDEPEQAQAQLAELIKHFQEGADSSEI